MEIDPQCICDARRRRQRLLFTNDKDAGGLRCVRQRHGALYRRPLYCSVTVESVRQTEPWMLSGDPSVSEPLSRAFAGSASKYVFNNVHVEVLYGKPLRDRCLVDGV